jgi:hypothetical protein
VTCLEELLQEKPGKKQEHGENEQNMLGTETDSDSDESNCDKDEPYEVETDETVSSQDEDDFVDDIR